MSVLEQAIRQYASHAPFDLLSPSDIQRDLRAIAGDRHTHKAAIGTDLCALCLRDLRDEIHLRIDEI